MYRGFLGFFVGRARERARSHDTPNRARERRNCGKTAKTAQAAKRKPTPQNTSPFTCIKKRSVVVMLSVSLFVEFFSFRVFYPFRFFFLGRVVGGRITTLDVHDPGGGLPKTYSKSTVELFVSDSKCINIDKKETVKRVNHNAVSLNGKCIFKTPFLDNLTPSVRRLNFLKSLKFPD